MQPAKSATSAIPANPDPKVVVPLGPSVGGLNTTTATGQLVGKVVSLFPHDEK